MINFFRKIRQKMIANGKTGKYLKYALGEIVLVVIGILIALQINTYNGNLIEQRKESRYLKNLERDLNDQISSIDDQIANESKFSNAAKYVIEHYAAQGLTNLDSSFFAALSDLHTRKTFVVNDPTLTDLLSSGNIDLIRSQSLKDKLIQYYHKLERIEKIIQYNNSQLTDEQFGNTFVAIGYYQSNYQNEREYGTDMNRDIELTGKYYPELAAISEGLLQDPKHQLNIMNLVNLRLTVALSHVDLMLESKEATEKLIEELKNICKDE